MIHEHGLMIECKCAHMLSSMRLGSVLPADVRTECKKTGLSATADATLSSSCQYLADPDCHLRPCGRLQLVSLVTMPKQLLLLPRCQEHVYTQQMPESLVGANPSELHPSPLLLMLTWGARVWVPPDGALTIPSLQPSSACDSSKAELLWCTFAVSSYDVMTGFSNCSQLPEHRLWKWQEAD